MKRLSLVAMVAALAAAVPAHAFGATFRGVVVGRTGGTMAVATAKGAVHTLKGHARIGTVVRVSGTAVRAVGRAHRAKIQGVVVRRIGRTTFVAAGRSLLAVQARRALAGLSSRGPRVGSVVLATVDIAGGRLVNERMEERGRRNAVAVVAMVTAVGNGTITVSVNGQTLTIPLPAGLTLPATVVGQSVTITIRLADDDVGEDDDDDNAGPGNADDDNAGPGNVDDDDDQGDADDDDDNSGDDGGHGGHGGHGGGDG